MRDRYRSAGHAKITRCATGERQRAKEERSAFRGRESVEERAKSRGADSPSDANVAKRSRTEEKSVERSGAESDPLASSAENGERS